MKKGLVLCFEYYKINIECMLGGGVNMGKKGGGYVVEVLVKREIFEVDIVEKGFEMGGDIYKGWKGKMVDKIEEMRKDESYEFWVKEEKWKRGRKKLMEIGEGYDVSKRGGEGMVNDMGKEFVGKKGKKEKEKEKVDLEWDGVEKIGVNVWEWMEEYVLNGKRKKVGFKKLGELNRVERKRNK